jgi:hypothetical protein
MRGLSLMEVTVMLSVFSALTATMAPAVVDYVADAKRLRAASDVHVVAVGVAGFILDGNGQAGNGSPGWRACNLLVGAGATPGASDGTDVGAWTAPAGPGGACAIDDHLVTNRAGYGAMPRSAGSWLRHGWSGPYLSSVGPDPWGHRYAVNTRHLADGSAADTIVLSAGPDGIIETPFSVDGAAAGGDDLVALISTGR